MKNLVNSKYLPLFMAGLGIVGFALRRGLYAVALDHKNLLIAGHPLQWLLLLVTLAAMALAFLSGAGAGRCGTPGRLAALGCLALAVGISLELLPQGFSGGGLSRLRCILGILASLAMVAAAVQNLLRKPTFFLLQGIVCVFFAVHMVSCYQGWSSNPQILDYLYTLLAAVGLMLFAYQQSACAADCGSGKLLRLFGSVSIFCGITALSGTEFPALYLTGSFWALTALCCPEPVPAMEPPESPLEASGDTFPEETE